MILVLVVLRLHTHFVIADIEYNVKSGTTVDHVRTTRNYC